MIAEKLGFGARCRNRKQHRRKRERWQKPLDAPPSEDAVTP